MEDLTASEITSLSEDIEEITIGGCVEEITFGGGIESIPKWVDRVKLIECDKYTEELAKVICLEHELEFGHILYETVDCCWNKWSNQHKNYFIRIAKKVQEYIEQHEFKFGR